MTCRLLRLLAPGLLAFACSCKSGIDPRDPYREPFALTRAVLSACKAGDVLTYTRVLAGPRGAGGRPSDEGEMRLLRARLEGDPSHCFKPDDWRAPIVDGWNGELGASRLVGDELVITLTELGPDKLAVATLVRQPDGQWRFDRLRNLSRAAFEARGEPFSP